MAEGFVVNKGVSKVPGAKLDGSNKKARSPLRNADGTTAS